MAGMTKTRDDHDWQLWYDFIREYPILDNPESSPAPFNKTGGFAGQPEILPYDSTEALVRRHRARQRRAPAPAHAGESPETTKSDPDMQDEM